MNCMQNLRVLETERKEPFIANLPRWSLWGVFEEKQKVFPRISKVWTESVSASSSFGKPGSWLWPSSCRHLHSFLIYKYY